MLNSTSKITSASKVVFLDNPQIKPTFLKDTSVILTKAYTDLDPFSHDSFTEGSVGSIQRSGLFIYAYDRETSKFSILVDSNEWCLIELTGPHFEESEGCVMAKDLRLFTIEDEDLEL